MPRIVCVSDTHCQGRSITDRLPDGDILIHAGDLTYQGRTHEIESEISWFKSLLLDNKYKHIVFSAGNHDFFFENKTKDDKWNLIKDEPRLHYLESSWVNLMELKIYGDPVQPWFYDWAFNLPRGGDKLRGHWQAIPRDTDVLITHGPPMNILDLTPRGERVGCELLAHEINERLPNLKLHVFGHIHHSNGIEKISNTTYVNASICNEKYKPVQKIHVIDV